MQLSEFNELVVQVFGRMQGRSLIQDLVLPELGDRTSAEAIDAGVPVRDIWAALCDAMDVPQRQRWLADRVRR